MTRNLIAATLAAVSASVSSLGAASAQPSPESVLVAPGQTVQQALRSASRQAYLDKFRAKVLERGAPAMPSGRIVYPKILGGSVLSQTLTVGQGGSFPELQLSYSVGLAGLVGAFMEFASPNGSVTLMTDYSAEGYVKGHGTATFLNNSTLPPFSQPGKWVLTSAFIEDYAGNYTQYTQQQAARLFPPGYLTVVNNGPVDITPPVVTAGQILTPRVSLSSKLPQFRATLTGTDDVSGLSAAFVVIEPPGGSYGQVNQVPAPFPILSGTVDSYATIFAGQPTGKWTITEYAMCDVAGNCFDDTSASDVKALFGTTTFEVTN